MVKFMNNFAGRRNLSLASVLISLVLVSCKKEIPVSGDVAVLEIISIASGPSADWKLARSKAYKAVKDYPNDPNAYIMLGLASEQTGHRNDAIESLMKAVKLDPTSFPAQFHLGRMLLSAEHYEEALGPLKSAFKILPGNQETAILLARTLQTLGLYDDAIRYYIALSKGGRYKGRPEALNQVGVILVKKGDYDNAYKYFLESFKIDQSNPSTILNLAVVCDRYVGKKPAALKLYQKYLEITLKNPELKNKRAEIDSRMKEIISGN